MIAVPVALALLILHVLWILLKVFIHSQKTAWRQKREAAIAVQNRQQQRAPPIAVQSEPARPALLKQSQLPVDETRRNSRRAGL